MGWVRAVVRVGRSAGAVFFFGGVPLVAQREGIDSQYTAIRERAAKSAAPGVVFLEAAHTMLAAGRTEGTAPYYHGASYDDTASVNAYRRTLEFVWTEEEAALFDEIHGEARSLFLLGFWARRTSPLRLEGERLMEHHRRIAYAREHFPLPPGPRRYYDWETIRTGATEFDDRGVMYIRHGHPVSVYGTNDAAENPRRFPDFDEGLPDSKTRFPAVGGLLGLGRGYIDGHFFRVPFQAWSFRTGDSTFQVYFRACARSYNIGSFLPTPCGGKRDYRVVESALDVFSPHPMAVLGRRGRLPVDEFDAIAIGEQHLVSTSARGNYFGDVMATRDRGMVASELALTTDAHEFSFPRPIEARIDAVTIGRVGSQGYAHFTFAARIGDLTPSALGTGQVVYLLKVRAALFDAKRTVVARRVVERAYHFEQEPAREAFLSGVLSVPVEGPVESAQIVVEQEGGIGVEARATLAMPAMEAKFGVSDLILGRKLSTLQWVGAPDTVWFNPSGVAHLLDPVQVAWEVYGLARGTGYRAEVEIRRDRNSLFGIRGHGQGQLRFGFDERANGANHLVTRSLGIEQLEPGPYTVTLTIRPPEGPAISREARMRVEP